MKKFLKVFFVGLCILQLFIFSGVNLAFAAEAVDCSLTTNPDLIRTNTNSVTLTINGGTNLISGNNYSFVLNGNIVYTPPTGHAQVPVHGSTDGSNNITITNLNYNGFLAPPSNTSPLFPNPGTFSLSVVPAISGGGNAGAPFCTVSFSVDYSPASGNGCVIDLVNTPENTTSGDDILINVSNFVNQNDPNRRLYVRLYRLDTSGNQSGNPVVEQTPTLNQLTTSNVNLGKHEPGAYSISVYDGADILSGVACTLKPIRIVGPGEQGGGVGTIQPGGGGIFSGDFSGPPPPAVCDLHGSSSHPEYTCHTAIGDIKTSPGGFVESIMQFVLTLAGGIAVLLIMISGYRLIASQGNPEKLQGAREQLTAAIVGLLFVIFAVVILETIGFNILGLPGFGL